MNYHLHKNLLYHPGKRFIPRDEIINVIGEDHTSLIYGHFGVEKMVPEF